MSCIWYAEATLINATIAKIMINFKQNNKKNRKAGSIGNSSTTLKKSTSIK